MRVTNHHRQAGFTLIEVLISFFLVLMVMGIGALSLTTNSNKKKLVDPATELKIYARRAIQLAINNRRSFAIHLTEESFTLREAFVREKEQEDTLPQFSPLFEEEKQGIEPVLEHYELKDGVSLQVRRWGEKHFRPAEKDNWVFEPSGICEPLAIKLTHAEGMIEMEFNPLTAKIQEEAMVLGGENIDEF